MSLLISVCIYTFNRAKLLAEALESICNQTLPSELYELVVVDNRSTDDTRQVVKDYENRRPNLRYVYEERPGISFARNRGWKEAIGEYIGYLDDDGVSPPDWLSIASEVIRLRSPDLFGGPFYPSYLGPKPAWFKDEYGTFSQGDQARELISPDEYLSGGNLFVRRKLLEQIGGFDPGLGMQGKQIGYGEETAFIRRVRQANPEAQIYYEPRLYIYHRVRPEKMRFAWQLRHRFAQGRDGYLAFSDGVHRMTLRHILGILALPVVIALEATFGVILRDRKIYPYPQNYYYERVLQRIATFGKLVERLRAMGVRRPLMAENPRAEKPPVVVFAFNRPDKLRRVLAALKGEAPPRLVVYVDGPRGVADRPGVLACRALAERVDWTETELHFDEENRGSWTQAHIVSKVMERYPAAIFLEDDCLPSPGFYEFMRQALLHYAPEMRVFSIGAYQHLPSEFFRDYPYSFVSGARFIGWGWATWRDRWQEAWPYFEAYRELFDHLTRIPEVTGRDVPIAVRDMVAGRTEQGWDMRLTLATCG
jgi:glycosyltransferase involved in cell wall biosynthesis